MESKTFRFSLERNWQLMKEYGALLQSKRAGPVVCGVGDKPQKKGRMKHRKHITYRSSSALLISEGITDVLSAMS
jgi:hypothetical protein